MSVNASAFFRTVVIVTTSSAALRVLANLTEQTFVVFDTFRRCFCADCVGVSAVGRWAGARGSVVRRSAFGISTANSEEATRVLAESIDTGFLESATSVVSASDHTAAAVADEPISAIAIVLAFTDISQRSTFDMRVANKSILASADRSVGVGHALSVGAARSREGAGVFADAVEASLVWCAVIVISATFDATSEFADVAELARGIVGTGFRVLDFFAIANDGRVSSEL